MTITITQSAQLLDGLFGNLDPDTGAHILIWTLQDKRSHWFTDAGAAAAAAERLGQDQDTYVGVGLRGRNHGGRQRGKNDDVIGIGGLWADLDTADPVHKTANLPPDKAAGLALLADMPAAPSLVIDSGHGLQAWWLFKEPYIFESTDERHRIAHLAQAWNGELRRHAAGRGWKVDSAHDLARIMRVPGTINRKAVPVPVAIINAGPTYGGPSDFLDLVATPPAAAAPAPHAPIEAGDLPLEKWHALRANFPMVEKSWDHNRPDFADRSASVFDLSLASFAVQAGWNNADIASLIIAHRRHWNEPLKAADYIPRTIARARSGNTEKELIAQMPAVRAAEGSKDEQLAFLSGLLKCSIKAIYRRGSRGVHEAYYLDTVEYGEFCIGSNKDISSNRKLDEQMFQSIHVHIVRKKPAEWDAISEIIAKLAIDDLFQEAAPATELWEWVNRHIAGSGRGDDYGSKLAEYKPFVREGQVHVHLSTFKRYLSTAFDEMISVPDLRLRLRDAGFRSETIRERHKGAMINRSYWIAPAAGRLNDELGSE